MRESVNSQDSAEKAEYTALSTMADTTAATDLYPAVRSTQKNWSKTNIISLIILCFVNLINYMDRYTVSAILEEISDVLCGDEERCSKQKEGFLQTAFLLVYLLVAPVFGFLGDRFSRKYIMAAGVFLWGGISLTASFMTSYWPFLILRACIAIGESAFSTIAPTVLADLFDENSRSLVLGIFYLAIPVGSGLGYVIGGAPADWHNGLRITPGMNFVAVGLILFFLADPPRGISEHNQERKSYFADLKYILGVKSYLLNVAGFTCVTFTTGALSWFGPLYVSQGIKSYNKTMDLNETELEGVPIHPDSVAFIFGAVLMVSGILGVLGGMTLSKVLRPKYPKIDPLICGVSILISCPLLIGGLLTVKDNIILSFAIFTLGSTFLNMNWSISVDMSLYVIIPVRRSTAEAIHLMATHALGEAGAPYIIGIISDSIIKSSCPDDCQADDDDCLLNKCLGSSLSSYLGMQKALYLVFVLLVLGGILFILAALWIVPEKQTVDRLLAEQLEQLENKREEVNDEKDIKLL